MTWGRSFVVFSMAAVLVANIAGDAVRGLPRPMPRSGAAQGGDSSPAPKQQMGSGHQMGTQNSPEGRNRTVPESLRGRFPLHRLEQAKPAPANKAEVVSVPGNPVKGFDEATSREVPSLARDGVKVFANADGTMTSVSTPVDSGAPDAAMYVHGGSSSGGGSQLLVGRVDGANAATYLRFRSLAGQLQGHNIFGAQLLLVNYDAPSCKARPVTVHPVTQDWTAGGGYSYPGPSVGAAFASSSFAHGYIATGSSQSACPASGAVIDLGGGGQELVQRWANGQPNFGISVRASVTDSLAWKKFTGSGTANPPKLYVTHSPYNANYAIPNPVPEPPVLQNQDGRVSVTVTNLSASAWAPGDYYLAYRAYNSVTGQPAGQQRAANLTSSLARGASVTLTATIKAMPPGNYFIDFTMVRTGGVVFTDHQVPPGRIVLEVPDIAPVVEELYPPNGYQAPTLTPLLWARAVDIDAPPGLSLQFKFEICERGTDGKPVAATCLASAYQTAQAWSPPAGRLVWSKTYLWRAFVKDAGNEVTSPYSALTTAVAQPDITSRIAAAPYGSQEREFDPQVGNFSTAAIDAPVVTVGPELSLVRTYNSLDPRRDLAFGAGWTTRYDMRLVFDDDGSGNVVVTYPDGQQVRFGKNPDGSYAAPPGRSARLTVDGPIWTLLDKGGNKYVFSGSRITKFLDINQHAVNLTYDIMTGKLAKAQVSNGQNNTAGRSLSFTWTGNHITKVSTDATSWAYTYTGDLLTRVCAPNGTCTSYDYGTGSRYRTAVVDSAPESFWRFGESEGTAAGSEVAVNLGKDAGKYKNVTLKTPGALTGAANTAASFNGSSSNVELPKGTLKKSRDMAVELWFKLNLSGGTGALLGYQDTQLGTTPTVGVPILYVGTDGKLHGQFATGSATPILAQTPVTDGKWHHVVLSTIGTTQTLYLDGVKAGELTNATIDHTLLTFNQIGAAHVPNPSAWPAWGTNPVRHFNGAIDEVALYSHAIGPAAAAAHYRAGIAAADQMVKVILPSVKVAASVKYDATVERVSEYTDKHGGTWKLGAPLVSGGDNDLRRTIELRDPANRPHLFEYDALAGRLLRSGTPLGLTTRPEDLPGTPAPPPPPPPTAECPKPDPSDPAFCTIIPGGSGGPVFVKYPLDGLAVKAFSYDERGFQNVITNENGDQVTMTFTDRGSVASKKTCRTNTQCHAVYYTYPGAITDPLDVRNELPTETRDGRSASPTDNTYRTSYTYSVTGKLESQTNPDSSVVRHTYTTGTQSGPNGAMPAGLPYTATDARGKVTRFSYYANGDLHRVTTAAGLITEYTYDSLGRKLTEKTISDSYPSGATTTYTYDAMSRLAAVTEPDTVDAVSGEQHQRQTVNEYDLDGNLVRLTVKDLLSAVPDRVTTFEYDEHNQQVRVVDAAGNETTYGYDRFGNKTFMVDANDNRYEFAYTARNKLSETRLRAWQGDLSKPYLVLQAYTYDHAGRVASDTDAMGQRVEFGYYQDDLQQRVTLKNFDGTRDYIVEQNTYDGAGKLIRKATANGTQVTEYTLDSVGRVKWAVHDPAGLRRTTEYEYDANGNVSRTTITGQPSNVPGFASNTVEVVDHTYDEVGRSIRETVVGADGASRITEHTYDKRGMLTSTTDPAGRVTTAKYDQLGRLVQKIEPQVTAERSGVGTFAAAPTTTIGFNAFDEQVSERDEVGNVSRAEFDSMGRVVKQIGPSYLAPAGMASVVPTTLTGYDAMGNVIQVTDPRGKVTKFGYDQLNRAVVKDEPGATDGQRAVWRYTYTPTGEVLSVTDPNGARAESTYDALDRKVTSTQVERHPSTTVHTSKLTYDDASNLVRVETPGGAVTTNTFDAVGQVTATRSPAGVVTQFGYDYAGRPVRRVDAQGRETRKVFDRFGRLTRESDLVADGSTLRTQSYGYDAAGNLTSATDHLGVTTIFTYDAANQLVEQVEPVSATASIRATFGYDEAGRRTRFTDGRGNTTTYTYNALGLPESVTEPATAAHPDPADRTWTVSYDAAGLATRLTLPGGVSREHTYDAAGRLIRQSGAGAESATTERIFTYDLAGRLVAVNAMAGTNTFSYNDRGALLSASGPSGSASFGYNADGLLTSRTDAAGTATFDYANGRLSAIVDGLTGTRQSLSYNAVGDLSEVDLGNGRKRKFGHDALGRLNSDVMLNPAGQTIASVAYEFDLNDHMTRKSTTGTAGAGDNRYGYDLAGRLISWTSATGAVSYEWDASGNRVRAGAKQSTFDERNRLIGDGDYTYEFTARGTLKSRASSGLVERFSFDAFDRMVTAAGIAYSYDGLNRVTARGSTNFSYAGASTEPVSDGTETFARGPGGELLAVARGAVKRLVLADSHGDIVASVDPAGTGLSGSKAFDPFGKPIARQDEVANVGYQGDWTDPSTGQVNMGARWYEPSTGAFVSRDSVDYQSGDSILANRYTYGAGAPLDFDDPDGHWPKWMRSVGSAISNAWTSTVNAFSNAVSTIADAAERFGRWAWSSIKSVASDLWEKGKQVVNTVRNAWNNTVQFVKSAWQKTKEAAAQAWQRAVQVTQQAKAAVTKAVQRYVLPVAKAVLKPIIAVTKAVVSAGAHLAAKVTAVVRDVVKDTVKAAQHLYKRAVETAGEVIKNVSKAAQAVGEWVVEHKAAIAGFVAGAVVGVGCGALIGWTGIGAVACGALAGVVGSLVHDLVEGGKSWKEMAGNALTSGLIGGLTGGAGSILGRGLQFGVGEGWKTGMRAMGQEVRNIASGRITGGRVGDMIAFRHATAYGQGLLDSMEGLSKNQLKKAAVVVGAVDRFTGKGAAASKLDSVTAEIKKNFCSETICEVALSQAARGLVRQGNLRFSTPINALTREPHDVCLTCQLWGLRPHQFPPGTPFR